jgi:hypothetical protein
VMVAAATVHIRLHELRTVVGTILPLLAGCAFVGVGRLITLAA